MSKWSGANVLVWQTTSTSRHWIQTTTTFGLMPCYAIMPSCCPPLHLDVRRTRLSTVGDRAFPVAAARLWNSLPSHVTSASLSPSSALILNHISSHFLIPLSDSSLICAVPAHCDSIVMLDTIVFFITFNIWFNFYIGLPRKYDLIQSSIEATLV